MYSMSLRPLALQVILVPEDSSVAGPSGLRMQGRPKGSAAQRRLRPPRPPRGGSRSSRGDVAHSLERIPEGGKRDSTYKSPSLSPLSSLLSRCPTTLLPGSLYLMQMLRELYRNGPIVAKSLWFTSTRQTSKLRRHTSIF